VDDEVLTGYLQHHWAGSTAGVAAFRRVGRNLPDTQAAAEIRDLAGEVAADREALRVMMRRVGTRPSVIGTTLARVGELLGRLKPNGSLVHRTPLTDVVELETLRLAVTGKRAGFEVLRAAADDDQRLDPFALDRLLARADEHLRTLERLHVTVSRDRLVGHPS
jgi:hypothetical protein